MIEGAGLNLNQNLTGAGFWLVWSKHRALIPQAEQVRDWLIANAEPQTHPELTPG